MKNYVYFKNFEMEKVYLTRFVRGTVDIIIALTRTVRPRLASPHSPPAKLDSDKFEDPRRTKPDGFIESCTQGVWAPPQNQLGLRPGPRSGWGLGQ